MGDISFNQIPSNLRIPFVAVEIDNSRAQQGPALLAYTSLLLGQKTSSGGAADNTIHRVTNADQLIALAGRGSMLHRMAKKHFANNTTTETYVGVIPDNGAGVAASGSVLFGGTVTGAGTLNFYIGGERVQVGVASGQAPDAIAVALAAAINANTDLPVTAAIDGSVDEKVNITFRHKGVTGNELDMRVNYQDGEALPAGLTATITAMANGTSNPVLTSIIAAMGDEWYNVIAFPYTDATSLAAIETELSSRFGPMRMIDGVAISASSASHGTLGTLGDSRNSQHLSIVATNQSPTPPYEYAAAVAAVAAFYGAIDPARPFQTLALADVLAPAKSAQFSNEERNLLLFDGISTTKVSDGGVVRVDRLITTYKTNAAGAQDTSYLDVNTMLTLMYLRFSFRNQILNRYPRHKLGDDGARGLAGQAIITPKIGKAEAISWFRDMQGLLLVEASEEAFTQFKRDLIVERNDQDVNRLDFLLPPDIINQFIVGAVNIQFRL